MEKIVLSAQGRNVFGRKLKAFRKQGQIPAILYGHNLKPIPLFLKKAEFEKVLTQAGTSTLIDLKIENEKTQKGFNSCRSERPAYPCSSSYRPLPGENDRKNCHRNSFKVYR